MPIPDYIRSTPEPRTRASLGADLRQLGLAAGDVVIVHSSLKSIGYISGGPMALLQALMDVLTDRGTLVMPAHSGNLSDPANWENPPVPAAWWPVIRQHMPAFDPARTPTSGIGWAAEQFRTWPNVLRSHHPAVSFAAWGAQAAAIAAGHSLDFGLGERSPLARLYELDARVLLLGAPHGSNTSFHLGEYRATGAVETEEAAPMMLDGRRQWRAYRELEFHEELFDELGAAFEAEQPPIVGPVGSAMARLFPQRACVDFAAAWIGRWRTGSGSQPDG